MAKNWKVGEAVEAIKSGNREDIQNIGKRFPIFAVLAGQTNEAGVEILKALPEYITARKIEGVLKGDIQETEDTEETEAEEDEKPVKAAKAPKAEKVAEKSAKELFDECKKRGLKPESKRELQYYEGLITKDDARKAKEAKEATKVKKVEAAPVKETKKAKAEKPAKKAEEAEDEDWDV